MGENVERHPELYQQIIANGHQVGNHTFNHLQGLKTPDEAFLANVEKAATYVDSKFMRPPHGWLRKSQYRELTKDYEVVMWDLISRDYKEKTSPKAVVSNVMNFVRPGSIIIFHDSVKAQKNLRPALPVVIKKLKEEGYQFTLLPEKGKQKTDKH